MPARVARLIWRWRITGAVMPAGLNVVLRELQSHSTEMAVVIDEYGAPAGVVTLEDLVEELVGEIEDEYDPAVPGEYLEVEPAVWSIAATSRPDEIERYTGFILPDGEYDTVAGLMLDRLERIGEVGDAVVVVIIDVGVRIGVVHFFSVVDSITVIVFCSP